MKWKQIAHHARIMEQATTGAIPIERYKNVRYLLRDDVLYICGTDDLNDMKQNVSLSHVESRTLTDSICVAQGFHDHANDAYGSIKEHLDDITLIVAHSMGGAVAEILSHKIHVPTLCWSSCRGWQKTPIPSFACAKGSIRIWHRSDPVASWAPKWLGWKFAAQDLRPHGIPPFLGLPLALFGIIKPHSMTKYREHAEKMARKGGV